MKHKSEAPSGTEKEPAPRATGPGRTEAEEAPADQERGGGEAGEAKGGGKLDLLGLFAEAKDHIVYAQIELLMAVKAALEGLEKGVEVRGGEGSEIRRLAESASALRGLVDLAIRGVERFASPRDQGSKMRALSAIRDVLERERTEACRGTPGPAKSAAVDGLAAIIRVLDREIGKIEHPKAAARSKPPAGQGPDESDPGASPKADRVRKVPIG